MRYNGKGNPAAVLASCLTLGFLPQILLIMFLVWLPVWAYILSGCLLLFVFLWRAFK